MAAKPRRAEALATDTQEQERLALARQLVRKETRRREMEDRDLAKLIGRDKSTVSHLVSVRGGKKVSDETWYRVGKEFEWGSWLDFVKSGNIGAVRRHGKVDQEIRGFAIERLHEIAGTENNE